MGDNSKIPAHVAIIMDGNGRWARQKGMDRIFGHSNGVESVRAVVRASVSNGVKYLTLYAFSTENWGRPKEEVDALMELLCTSIINEVPELISQGVKVKMMGETAGLSEKVLEHMARAEKETSGGENLTVILALNYSARYEIVRAVRNIAAKAAAKAVRPEDITAESFSQELMSAPWPDPDLLIRTSGEERLSNFMLWQMAYTELYFTTTLWPDFREKDFDAAIEAYGNRERRYGLITQQK